MIGHSINSRIPVCRIFCGDIPSLTRVPWIGPPPPLSRFSEEPHLQEEGIRKSVDDRSFYRKILMGIPCAGSETRKKVWGFYANIAPKLLVNFWRSKSRPIFSIAFRKSLRVTASCSFRMANIPASMQMARRSEPFLPSVR